MKVILAMIYMRTVLALEGIKLTPTMSAIINKCLAHEQAMFRKQNALYRQCQSIAKDVWLNTHTHEDILIHVEPVVCGLYYSIEAEMKKAKFKPTLINRLYDQYFNVTKCDLETIGRELADEIWNNTNTVMRQRIAVAA